MEDEEWECFGWALDGDDELLPGDVRMSQASDAGVGSQICCSGASSSQGMPGASSSQGMPQVGRRRKMNVKGKRQNWERQGVLCSQLGVGYS